MLIFFTSFVGIVLYLIILCIFLKLNRGILVPIFILSLLLGSVTIPVGNKNINVFFSDIIFLLLLVRLFVELFVFDVDLGEVDARVDVLFLTFMFIFIWYFIVSLLSVILVSIDKLRSLAQLIEVLRSQLCVLIVYFFCKGSVSGVKAVLRCISFVAFSVAFLSIFSAVESSFDVSRDVISILSLNKGYALKHNVSIYLGNNNYLAGIIVLAVPIVIALLRYSSRKFFVICGLFLMVIALFVTGSRGAIASLFVVLFMSYGLTSIKSFVLLISVLLAVIMSVDISSFVLLFDKVHHSFNARLSIWQFALGMFANDAILFGVGLGNFRTLFDIGGVHNSILSAFVETGMLGGILFLFSLVSLLIFFVIKYLNLSSTSYPYRGLFGGIIVSLLIGITHSMGEPLLGKHIYDSLFYTLVGLGFVFPVTGNCGKIKQFET